MSVNQIDYATLTVGATAVNLVDNASPPLPPRAKGAILTVETDSIRWRADGTAPTASEGHLFATTDTLTFDSWSTPRTNWRSVLAAIQFIRVTSDAKLKISYFD